MVRYAAALLSFCAILVAAGRADAQYFGRNKVRYDHLDFRLLQTEHFDIYYYAEEEAATREAARMAERWYARFSRVLQHRFAHRQPLVLYASHPHFAQTNLTAGSPGEGVGGFTERTKSRIAMPFTAGLGETDHVLGHEIAHAFQIDIAKSVKQNAFALPAWFIEGMAEYLSLGTSTPHTTMWVRDAARHERLPTLKQLDDPRYFPYRFGHALWSYLATRFGDEVVGRILRSKARGVLGRLEEVTGIETAQLTRDWHASIDPGVPGDRRFRSAAVEPDARARIHVAPSLSPDGDRLMFLSERERLSLDLFLADTSTGQVLAKIISTAADPHFDSLQYIHSSGAWDPSGRRFALTALSGGNPVLVVVDVEGGARQEIRFEDLSEIFNPSWSPDGRQVVFSALKGGLSDLFAYTFETGALRQLTADAFADLHPAWSPDGRTIAFVTDRFTTRLADLGFGAMRIGLLDLGGMMMEPLLADGTSAKQVSPQWSPDGRALYFVSDRGGVSNVFRTDLDSRQLRQVTDVGAGVSGITATSPALAVASRAGTLAFSVYREGRYEIETITDPSALAGRVVEDVAPAIGMATSLAAIGAPSESAGPLAFDGVPAADGGPLAALLGDARYGLPDEGEFTVSRYDDRLQLESISQPYVGAATGPSFGGLIRASFGVTFGDMLRDRQLQTLFRVGTDADDLAGQISYLNRKGQWNWGMAAGVMPSHFYGARRSLERDGEIVTRETQHLRYMHQWGGLAARYNMSRARRFELGLGIRRTGFEWQTVTRITDSEQGVVSRELEERPAGRPVYLAETQAALVHDTAVLGPTSPVLGQRVRLEVQPAFGGLTFADVRVDARRYFMPVRPVTVAARVEHVGRYGPSAADYRLTPLIAGLQTLVRGYDLRSFAADECGRSATECSIMEQLTGSRLALLNLEVRAPLLGLFTGELAYGSVPIEAVAFADAGFLWTRGGDGATERDRFRSVGAGARANLGGIVFEMTAARPFDRSGSGWTVSFLLRPGF